MVQNRMYIKPRSSTLEEQTTFLTTLNNRQFDLILLFEPLGSIKSITQSQSLKTCLRTCYTVADYFLRESKPLEDMGHVELGNFWPCDGCGAGEKYGCAGAALVNNREYGVLSLVHR